MIENKPKNHFFKFEPSKTQFTRIAKALLDCNGNQMFKAGTINGMIVVNCYLIKISNVLINLIQLNALL